MNRMRPQQTALAASAIRALVLTPTRELAAQVEDSVQNLRQIPARSQAASCLVASA
jgi:superfamily II DNA/RNA helicase